MDLLQEAETADDGVDFKIEEKNSKCRKILSSVKCALRGSFRKCGFRRLVGPVHEGIHILQVLSLRLKMNLQEIWRSSWSMRILVWFYWSRLQEAEIADDSVELQTEEKNSK